MAQNRVQKMSDTHAKQREDKINIERNSDSNANGVPAKELHKDFQQVKGNVRDLLVDIKDDPIVLDELKKELEKCKDFNIGELAEMVPNLKKYNIIQNKALTAMARALIINDEKLQVIEYANAQMANQLTVRDRDKINKASQLYEEAVKTNITKTKSRIYNDLKEAYKQTRELTR
jgi:hypothetical protein